MNITLAGTKVSMDGHTLAFQKNNLIDSMVITVDTDETWQYKLDVKYPCKDSDGKELYNVIDLTRVGNTCTAILQASMLPFNGKYTMQLRGISGNKVYHTDTFDVWVKYSIDPGKVYDPVPSEFYQIESNITSMNNHPPKSGDNGYWLIWNVLKQEYEESDVPLPEDTLPEVSDSTNGWYLTNDGERVYWAEVQGGSGEGDITAIQVNGINQPIVDKVAKLTIGKDTVGLGNLDNVRQYSSVNQPPYPVTSVAGKTGAVTLTKADVGLGNVDNTSDANKPISAATQTALNGKLDKTEVVDVTADAIKGQAADAKSVYDVIQALPTGTDLSLGITGATVGQTVVVKAVDDSGKPTEWEAIAADGAWQCVTLTANDYDAENHRFLIDAGEGRQIAEVYGIGQVVTDTPADADLNVGIGFGNANKITYGAFGNYSIKATNTQTSFSFDGKSIDFTSVKSDTYSQFGTVRYNTSKHAASNFYVDSNIGNNANVKSMIYWRGNNPRYFSIFGLWDNVTWAAIKIYIKLR